MSGAKRKTSGNTDFKRVKAKVGRKVQKALNETDTTFKSSSLHVSGQLSSDGTNQGTSLVSARGKSMIELVSQFGHPASAVRISAMKGIGNLIREHKPHTLRPHLSTLLPVAARSVVDEDQDVRAAGLSALGDLYPGQDSSTIRPFFSLLVAYTSSALHSLDSKMRVDGAQNVKLLSTFYSSLVKPHAFGLLAPFVNILADPKANKYSEQILQALNFLLDAAREESPVCGQTNFDELEQDDVVICPGKISCAILPLEAQKIQQIPQYFSGLSKFPSLQRLDLGHGSALWDKSPFLPSSDGLEKKVQSIHDILSKLRDLFSETVDQEDEHNVVQVTKGALNVPKIRMLVEAISATWKLRLRYKHISPNAELDSTDRMAWQVTVQLMDVFPIKLDDARKSNVCDVETLNAMICSLTMSLAFTKSPEEIQDAQRNNGDWTDSLCSYLIPCLGEKTKEPPSTAISDAFCKLVLLLADAEVQHRKSQHSLMENLYKAFFNPADISLARSPAGRKAAATVVELVSRALLNEETLGCPREGFLTKMVETLPRYLIAWKGDFLSETRIVIDMYCNLARRVDKPDENSTLSRVRDLLGGVVVEDSHAKGSGSRGPLSIFEHYPFELRALFLALLRSIGSPNKQILEGLASTCTRINMSGDLSDEDTLTSELIIEVAYSLRTEMSMQDFFGFLISTIGVPTATESSGEKALSPESWDKPLDRIFMVDVGVRRISKSLLRCGSVRVLRVLGPQLRDWLEKANRVGQVDTLVRFRVATTLLGIFAHDLGMLPEHPSVFEIFPDFVSLVCDTTLRVIRILSSHSKLLGQCSCLLSPVTVLLKDEPLVSARLTKEIEHVKEQVSETEIDNIQEALRCLESGLLLLQEA